MGYIAGPAGLGKRVILMMQLQITVTNIVRTAPKTDHLGQ